jgi:hypothetical protein
MFEVSTIKTLFDSKSQEKIHRFSAVQLLMKLKKITKRILKKIHFRKKKKGTDSLIASINYR